MDLCAFCGSNCDNLDYNAPVAPDALCDSCRKVSPKKWCDKCLTVVFGDKWLDKVKEALLNMDDVILAPVCPNCRTNQHVKPVRDTSQCSKCGYVWQFIMQEKLAVEYPHDALIAAKNLCYLPENLKKGNSWKNLGMAYLFSKLQFKFQELIQASIDEDFQKVSPDFVAELCLHVINYLAFIYKRKISRTV